MKNIVLEVLSDGKEHTSNEIKDRIREAEIEIDSKSSTLRMAIYQLRNCGVDIYSRDRGIYQIREKNIEEYNPNFKGFITIMPEQRQSLKCVYIHSDGNIVLNGKLNSEIKSRKIEIRIADDGKKIALIPDGENNHKFTKNGNTKNMSLLKQLKSNHINVPTAYEMKLDINTGVWIGEISNKLKMRSK